MSVGLLVAIGIIFLLCTICTIISFYFFFKVRAEVAKTKGPNDDGY